MNAQSMATKAYGDSIQTVRSPRGVEYDAIARITHDLKVASETMDANFASFVEALHRNNQLWSVLATSVAAPDNQLPAQVRAQIFYLAEFTQRHAAQALAGRANVDPLLEINTAVLRGLRQGRGM